MAVIINVRGTGGSGKSSAIFYLMKAFGKKNNIISKVGILPGAETGYRLDKNGKRVVGYRLNKDVLIVGRYDTPTGGCDQIKTQDEICDRVKKFAKKGKIVVFEGLLISGLYSRYRDLSRSLRKSGNKFIWAFLDTPLKTCIKRTIHRRKARGNKRPFNSKNTELKYRAVELALRHATEDKESIITLDGNNAGKELVKITNKILSGKDDA